LNWLDVTGSPGCGKSTLCDPLWGPHDLPIEDRLPPVSWHDFLNEISRLFWLIRGHPTLPAAVRMVNRSVRKIATVARLPATQWCQGKVPVSLTVGGVTYIQTALAQRGLGFGWRLVDLGLDINELRHYFRLMPVSIGVAFLEADEATVIARNRKRRENPKTAHEDRSAMVPLMRPAIALAKEVLHARGVPVIEIDVAGQSIDAARAQLLAFADQAPRDAEALRFGCEVPPILSPPPWWRS
jgi:hypothetical protein